MFIKTSYIIFIFNGRFLVTFVCADIVTRFIFKHDSERNIRCKTIFPQNTIHDKEIFLHLFLRTRVFFFLERRKTNIFFFIKFFRKNNSGEKLLQKYSNSKETGARNIELSFPSERSRREINRFLVGKNTGGEKESR